MLVVCSTYFTKCVAPIPYWWWRGVRSASGSLQKPCIIPGRADLQSPLCTYYLLTPSKSLARFGNQLGCPSYFRTVSAKLFVHWKRLHCICSRIRQKNKSDSSKHGVLSLPQEKDHSFDSPPNFWPYLLAQNPCTNLLNADNMKAAFKLCCPLCFPK